MFFTFHFSFYSHHSKPLLLSLSISACTGRVSAVWRVSICAKESHSPSLHYYHPHLFMLANCWFMFCIFLYIKHWPECLEREVNWAMHFAMKRANSNSHVKSEWAKLAVLRVCISLVFGESQSDTWIVTSELNHYSITKYRARERRTLLFSISHFIPLSPSLFLFSSPLTFDSLLPLNPPPLVSLEFPGFTFAKLSP